MVEDTQISSCKRVSNEESPRPVEAAKLEVARSIENQLEKSSEIDCQQMKEEKQSTTPDLAKVRQLAVKVVLEACQLTCKVQKNLTDEGVVSKSDHSPVTIADLGAQAVVSHRLLESFPQIPLVGEEDAGVLRADPALAAMVVQYVREIIPEISASQVLADIDRGMHPGGRGLFWVLDPIDGTKGFLRREQYAVCLGLVQDGEVLVAVLGCPNLPVDPGRPDGERGCLFVAVHGQGSTQYDIVTGAEKQISVSNTADSSEACFVESVESGHSDHGRQASLARALKITHPSVRMDSQCKFGVVARGEASLYLRFSAKPNGDQNIWDIAAGAKIVQEAGGKVSDARGAPLNFAHGRTIGTGDLFASNGLLHEQVLSALRQQVG